MPREYDEKRDFVRVAVDSKIAYGIVDDDSAHEGKLKNLSGRGMMFIADTELEKDTLVDVRVEPENELTPPLRARVKVVRVLKQRHGDGYEIGAVIQSMLDE